MQKLTDQGYRALLYAITNRKDEISLRLQNEVDSHSDFLEKTLVCLARYRSKYIKHKTFDQRKSKCAKYVPPFDLHFGRTEVSLG